MGEWGIAPLFLTWHCIEVHGQLHIPAVLTPGKEPWYALDMRLVDLQSRYGCCGKEKCLLPLPGIEQEK
jgi:hypothetical protein